MLKFFGLLCDVTMGLVRLTSKPLERLAICVCTFLPEILHLIGTCTAVNCPHTGDHELW